MDDDNADLRAQLAEARTDKKFADMLGEVRVGFAGIDAKFSALEARIDGKFAAIDGKFAAIEGKITGLEGRLSALEQTVSSLKPTIILTGLGVAALMVATLTYGQTWFGIGVSTRDIVKSAVAEYISQHPTPEAK